jgi:hypothetical protein
MELLAFFPACRRLSHTGGCVGRGLTREVCGRLGACVGRREIILWLLVLYTRKCERHGIGTAVDSCMERLGRHRLTRRTTYVGAYGNCFQESLMAWLPCVKYRT